MKSNPVETLLDKIIFHDNDGSGEVRIGVMIAELRQKLHNEAKKYNIELTEKQRSLDRQMLNTIRNLFDLDKDYKSLLSDSYYNEKNSIIKIERSETINHLTRVYPMIKYLLKDYKKE